LDLPQLYRFSDITVDVSALRVCRGPTTLDIEPRIFRLLLYLIENRSRVVTKEELVAQVWEGVFVSDGALTRAISLLRKHLGDNAKSPRFIETSATTGYRFIGEIDKPAAPPKARVARPRVHLAIAGGVLVVIGLAIAAKFTSHEGRAQAPAQLRALRQLTASGAIDIDPSFSPDDSQIVFSSNRNGHFQLYVSSVMPGSAARQITSDGEEKLRPRWSPDGRFIAFEGKEHGGVAIVPASGGVARYLSNFGTDPAWSPDSRRLVFRSREGSLGPLSAISELVGAKDVLWLVGLNGEPPYQLTHPNAPAGGHASPRWLKDNRRIMFASGGLETGGLWIVDTISGQTIPVSRAGGRATSATISADERVYYFISAEGSSVAGIWSGNIGSGESGRREELFMPATGLVQQQIELSHDGTHMALSQPVRESSIWTTPIGAAGMATGKPRRLIRYSSDRNAQPTFSGDGSKIAWQSHLVGDDYVIMQANSDGTGIVPVTPPGRESLWPTWIGSDFTIGYTTIQNNALDYWLIHPNGVAGRIGLDSNKLRGVTYTKASRQGTHLAGHVGDEDHSDGIVVIDLPSGHSRRLTHGRDIGFPIWSPDGRWIAAEERFPGKDTAVAINAETGDVKTLSEGFDRAWAGDWDRTSDRVVFAGERDDIWNIYWVSRSSGRIAQITHFAIPLGFVRSPAWSPKGDQIAFEHSELTSNIFIADLSR
jgi:Tol biopolymer transport system component/DNA-binding winged helix-turn-helix (wHTH) protein